MSITQKHGRFIPLFVVIGVVAIAAVTFLWAGQPEARADQQAQGITRVGTFDIEQVFQTYPGREDMMEAQQEAQPQMAEAQQEGDHQKMQEIQQQLQQKQQEVIDTFHDDVEAELPDIADDANVQVIAVEVEWTADGIDTTDVTDDVVEALGGEVVEEEPMLPPMPE